MYSGPEDYEVRGDIAAVKRAHEIHKDPARIAAIKSYVASEKQVLDEVRDMLPTVKRLRFNNSTV